MVIKNGDNKLEVFRNIKSKVTPLDRSNIDTDQIIPKQFLKLVQRTNFGKYLFYDLRVDRDGNQRREFVLNDPKYAGRQILLTRDNFGSGSSREHAAWAIMDYGFKAIIAESFADIFYNNCFKNGLLPISLNHEEIEYLFRNSANIQVEIDLSNQLVKACSKVMHFEIDSYRKMALLQGLDEIETTLQFESQITEYEKKNSGIHYSVMG
ncbi:MAG TPA: 3-isopropylmalate dehydratase small subunit [Nitrososphaeraceae archaeon]|jgi:3-isopropylmalate/(R)-2-methylmalate dehydratase small subunit|nr:3-isopropylmalate dehydratase small subunit [Nitrososphaeraceae archaeon]